MTKTTNKFSPEVRERAVRRRLLDQEKEYLIAEPRPAPKQQQLTPKTACNGRTYSGCRAGNQGNRADGFGRQNVVFLLKPTSKSSYRPTIQMLTTQRESFA